MNQIGKAPIMAIVMLSFTGAPGMPAHAQEELRIGAVTWTGKSIPGRDNPQQFIPCDGKAIEPLPEHALIIEVEDYCVWDDDMVERYKIRLVSWIQRKIQPALQQHDVATAQELLAELAKAEQSVREVLGYVELRQEEALRETIQALQKTYVALGQGDLQVAERELAAAVAPAQQQRVQQVEQQTAAVQPGEQPAQPAEGPLAQMPASDLLGANVVNEQGETIATVDDIVRRPGGPEDELYAVLEVGGFLGIGAREIAVPLNELEVGADNELIMRGVTQEQLEQRQPYERDQFQTAVQ